MANITESPDFNPVTRIEVTDTVGPGGNELNAPNRQFKQLADRDKWLEQAIALLGLNNYPSQTIADVKELLAGDATAALSEATGTALNLASIAQGRLTVVSGDPVPATDQTARTTIFYTPYNGDQVSLWNDGANRWDLYTFTERSLSLSGLTANQNYDVFLWDNAGTLTLQAVAWSTSAAGSSTRASAISRKNGVWVKTSDNRRYLGMFRTTSVTGQTEDTFKNRLVWNLQNQVNRSSYYSESGAHTYSGGWRPYNNDLNFRLTWVNGLSWTYSWLCATDISGGTSAFGVAVNQVVSANTWVGFGQGSGSTNSARGAGNLLFHTVPAGFNFAQLMQTYGTGTTLTFHFAGLSFLNLTN